LQLATTKSLVVHWQWGFVQELNWLTVMQRPPVVD
jgi:hypothetical protein